MGLDTLEYLIDKCTFPWLLSNVLDAHTHKPLGGAKESRVVVIGGVKVGLIGLAEKEWVKSLAYINYDDMIYESFIHEAAKLAKELRKRDVRLISVRNYFDFLVRLVFFLESRHCYRYLVKVFSDLQNRKISFYYFQP